MKLKEKFDSINESYTETFGDMQSLMIIKEAIIDYWYNTGSKLTLRGYNA